MSDPLTTLRTTTPSASAAADPSAPGAAAAAAAAGALPEPEPAPGYFIDWNGQARRTDDPGGGWHCDVDRPARYVGVLSAKGALMHEATFYPTLAHIDKAGIRATLVPGSEPWGRPDEGL